MPNYRYSRLQNDLDDDDEEDEQQPPAAPESLPLKDSYRLRLVISGGIITMLIIGFVGWYYATIGSSICQMVCIIEDVPGQ